MINVPVYDSSGNPLENTSLPEEKFGSKVRRELLRDVVIMHEANHRRGTASTKTRGKVKGGGKKPWMQKHTGRARAGSIRSPLWKGGGVIFGPHPRDYSYSMNRKAKKAALQSAILSKLQDNEVVIIDKLEFDSPSTKKMANLLKSVEIRESCLIVMPELNEVIWKSSRNIYNLKVCVASDLNAYDVIKYKKLLIVKDVLDSI
ncbi:MAG: 50S ribosomal protein L4 [Candidatus Scalindua arabica]|uniref:Large ribosomal subunit protein uL4 n=1 Tax=Candidatus Scalindua arabica TaxID=1127984 RepID=A0A941W2L3_9BACT|nr:50S ribosomal protein L4 [Candidatus Scalindua arabica]